MQLKHAILNIRGTKIAALLVDIDQTYPVPGSVLIARAQRAFPTLPIVLISPRVQGFSRSYAHFDLRNIIQHINADEIEWHSETHPPELSDTPF